MELTYINHTKTHIIAHILEGETLGKHQDGTPFYVGPISPIVKVDGSDPAYADIVAKQLPIEDPMAPPGTRTARPSRT